jgi:hypothetical protein
MAQRNDWATGLSATSPRSPDSYRDRCGLFAPIPCRAPVTFKTVAYSFEGNKDKNLTFAGH